LRQCTIEEKAWRKLGSASSYSPLSVSAIAEVAARRLTAEFS
jgi:hypothetical protein